MKLVLVGGGGHCKSVMDSAKSTNKYECIVTTDNTVSECKFINLNVVGNDDILIKLFDEGYCLGIVTVGSIESTALRRELANKLIEIGFKLETIIDPSATVSNYSKIGNGCFIGKKAIVNADSKIGDNVIINSGAVIEHDCIIGDFSHISVNSVICGGVLIGNDTFIGANSTIIQSVRIGSKCVIGAGSLILKDVPNGMKVYGVWK